MNTYLKYQPPVIQFFAFLSLAAGFLLINFIVSAYFFTDVNTVLLNKQAVVTPEIVNRFKVAQLVSAVISFMVPAFLFGYFSSPKALPYIGIQKAISPLVLLATVLLLFFVQPFIGYLGYVNAHLQFGSLQNYINDVEAMYDRAMKVFLQMRSTGDFLINLFIMALLPAISEELFFRGAFQKALLRLTKSPVVAIIISALVFALLHGTLLKIIPIFALGLLLGTVYHISRNIWYTMTIHFINNGFALFAFYYASRSELLKKLSDDNLQTPIFLAIVSLAASVGLIYFIGKKSDEVFPKFITNDDNEYIA